MYFPTIKKFDNPDNIKKLQELYLSGLSVWRISQHFDCSHQLVIKQLTLHTDFVQKKKFIKSIPKFPCCGMRVDSEYHRQFPCTVK